MAINGTRASALAALVTAVAAFTLPTLSQAGSPTGEHKAAHAKSHQVHRSYWMVRQHGKLTPHPLLLGKHLNSIKFGRSQWPSLRELWNHESEWIPTKRNPSTGACGIPQANPCSKIPRFGSIKSQIKWGLSYIKARYGNPAAALDHWYAYNWY